MTPPSSGPPTVATAMTAPREPEYLPRSRGGISAPITTWARDCSPPMPTPWMTRKPISMAIDWDRPDSAEPMTNTTMAACTSSFLLYRSASLPQIGVVAVAASRDAVITQVYWDWVPSSLEVIVGRALETIVELSRPTNSASSRPLSASRVARLLIGAPSAGAVVTGGPARWVVLIRWSFAGDGCHEGSGYVQRGGADAQRFGAPERWRCRARGSAPRGREGGYAAAAVLPVVARSSRSRVRPA